MTKTIADSFEQGSSKETRFEDAEGNALERLIQAHDAALEQARIEGAKGERQSMGKRDIPELNQQWRDHTDVLLEQARAEALEEAAQICKGRAAEYERRAEEADLPLGDEAHFNRSLAFVLNRAAQAIRETADEWLPSEMVAWDSASDEALSKFERQLDSGSELEADDE